ncbi:hypothetical protein MMC17_005387 [Xylographa soralifera]|nr:hypothetical protein [Xylographa soralifera]
MADFGSVVDEQFQVPLGITISVSTATGSYFVFSGYSISATTLQDGLCVTDFGLPITVQPPLSISVPSGANASFQLTAQSMFVSSIGAATCSAGGVAIISAATTPIPLKTQQVTETISVTVTAIATVTPTSSLPNGPQTNGSVQSVAGPATGLSTGDRAAIGVAVPVDIIALLTVGTYLLISRHRRLRLGLNQPNRQELENRERRELQADEIRHEVDGHEAKHELFVEERRQELRGADHSHELEA